MIQSVNISLFDNNYAPESSLALVKQVFLSRSLYSGGEKQTINTPNNKINELRQVLVSSVKKIK